MTKYIKAIAITMAILALISQTVIFALFFTREYHNLLHCDGDFDAVSSPRATVPHSKLVAKPDPHCCKYYQPDTRHIVDNVLNKARLEEKSKKQDPIFIDSPTPSVAVKRSSAEKQTSLTFL